jgi:hypothetical protein
VLTIKILKVETVWHLPLEDTGNPVGDVDVIGVRADREVRREDFFAV